MSSFYTSDPNYLNKMVSNVTLSYEKKRRDLYQMSANAMETIAVVGTEFYVSENAEKHRTDLFDLVETGTPVLRRGAKFYLSIRFDRPFNIEQHRVRLVFNLGPSPIPTKGTSAVMLVQQKLEMKGPYQWDVNLDKIDEDTIVLEVQISASAPIGSWSCSIYTSHTGMTGSTTEYRCPEYIYILFNPWCKEDGVYWENESKLEEYILNDVGKIWKGTYKQPEAFRWVYGQFDEVVLPVIMILLERSDIAHHDRWNPVKVARAVAGIVNDQDDFGLIVGEWHDFSNGTSPFAWTGTVAIMEEFLKNNCNSVKFGQCWVFAGAITTICRALGIPCRPVTNYHSAHDTNGSLTVDVHFDSKGEKLDDFNLDSCWNFHVWNDVWMSRPDLPQGYGGWQAIDGTPQELSQDSFRCGPASVQAVKLGHVGFTYDTKFVYTEVNGDICSFQLDETKQDFCVININKDYVGKQIVTKAIGQLSDNDTNSNDDMKDITQLYKSADENEEKIALYHAIREVPLAQKIYEIPPDKMEDVEFKLTHIDSIAMGEPFRIIVNVRNQSKEVRTISIMMSVNSILYTGVTVHDIKKSNTTFKLQPQQSQTLSIPIKAEEYITQLSNSGILKMYAMANVSQTKQAWTDDDDFVVNKPNLDITINGVPNADGVFTAMFSFKNPLPFKLTNCSFSVQMVGAKERPDITNYRDINANEVITYNYTFSPKTAGGSNIIATFTSKQLTDITGSKSVSVL